MNPNPSVSYDLAQARIADLRHQARREGLARAAARSTPAGPAASPGSRPHPVRPPAPGRRGRQLSQLNQLSQPSH